MKLYEKLKLERKKQRYSMREVYEITGIDKASISRYENGTRIPCSHTLIILARFYSKSVDKFLKDVEL